MSSTIWPVAGLAVGVIRHGSLAWFHGHGVADMSTGTPVDQDTVFRVASMTKIITAVAVMQLQEQGLVDLEASAARRASARYRALSANMGRVAGSIWRAFMADRSSMTAPSATARPAA